MVKAVKAKERAVSVRTVRQETERELLRRIRDAGDVEVADQWMTLYERFQRCVGGVPIGARESGEGSQDKLPGTE